MTDRELDHKIDCLGDLLSRSEAGRDNELVREASGLIREISQAFKGIRYPTAAERNSAWARFAILSKAYYVASDKRREEWKKRISASEDIKAEVVRMAQTGWPHANGFEDAVLMVLGITPMIFAAKFALHLLTLGLFPMDSGQTSRRDELVSGSRSLKEAWAYFTENKDRMTREDKNAAFQVLNRVQGEVEKEWAKWKEEKQAEKSRNENAYRECRAHKERLIKEVENLLSDIDSPESSQRAKSLQLEWKSVGYAGRDYERDLVGQFRRAMDEFFETRKQFFEQRREQREEREREFELRRDRKKQLIEEAEDLSDDVTSKSNVERAKELQAEWKEIGFAGRDHEDLLWARFRSAVDGFFQARKEYFQR